MTESSTSGDSQITYFLVMKITSIKKCDVSFYLIFIDCREYKSLQLPQGRLNCSLQFADGVEIEETEGKPKVRKFMSNSHIINDDHPYPLTKVQAMIESMLSKVMKNIGYSSFHSLSKHVDINTVDLEIFVL